MEDSNMSAKKTKRAAQAASPSTEHLQAQYNALVTLTKVGLKQYNLRMRRDQLAVLDAVSEANGVPVSELIRHAVDAWIGGTNSARQPSTLAEEIEAHDSATWYGDPDAGVPVEGRVTVGKAVGTGTL
jgi:hypothetical protein